MQRMQPKTFQILSSQSNQITSRRSLFADTSHKPEKSLSCERAQRDVLRSQKPLGCAMTIATTKSCPRCAIDISDWRSERASGCHDSQKKHLTADWERFTQGRCCWQSLPGGESLWQLFVAAICLTTFQSKVEHWVVKINWQQPKNDAVCFENIQIGNIEFS